MVVRFGTWNVRTLLQADNMSMIAEEAERYKMDVVKVKKSRYRPAVAQRVPDFMTTAQDGDKVVSLTHRPPLPPGNTPGTHCCYRLSRPQGHSATGRIVTEKFQ